MIMYSESKKEIYDTEVHLPERMAADAKPITKKQHEALLKPVFIPVSKERAVEKMILNEMKSVLRKIAVRNLVKQGKLPEGVK